MLLLACVAGAESRQIETPVPDPSPAAPPGPMVARDEEGRATMHASRLAEPLRLDGVLDEQVYERVPGVSDFIQTEPVSGAPATERTEVWVFFDDLNIYIVARCWETRPERLVANEMRRDNGNVLQNDHFAFSFDTFHDLRTGVAFNIAPSGGRMDGQVGSGGGYSGDWNPVWRLATARFTGGWTLEAAVPFKSLRYRPGRDQTWGFNARRRNRWKNEISYLSAVPPGTGTTGTTRPWTAGTLVGIEAPPPARNIELKPYVVSSLSTDRGASPRIANEVGATGGLDVRYGITENVTANFTLNTDFAQVEADEQQVNLTRFSLFFPEKREFFLENQGLFAFGGAGTGGGGDVPILVYTRRIGLRQGREVPLRAGARLVAQAGRFTAGAMNAQSGSDASSGAPATNFSALRLRRDVLRRSSVGLVFTGRSAGETAGAGPSQTYGVDASFGFFSNLALNAYWAQTRADHLRGDDRSYRAQLNYNGDRYGLQLERLAVGANFRPEVGFVRRPDMRRTSGSARFSPRPASIGWVRKFSWTASMARVENGAGVLETRTWDAEFGVERQNGDTFEAGYGGTYERLPRPFRIAAGVVLPAGGYEFAGGRAAYNFGRQRPISGNVSAEHGAFYNGRRTTLAIGQGRVNLSPQLSIEPSVSANWVDLAQGSFTTRLINARVTYTVTPLMFVSALLQYNASSHLVSANVRLRWEYRPGSELFVVLNEQRDTLSHGLPELANRALIVKVNRLVRF
ncbi:MAG: carbohydrate binding family 9 domain-containing protein [Acidobacteria bacterium]|nr:carbohydrate binding family 9 domain-containing protein [Acidobacteriota bacterium]